MPVRPPCSTWPVALLAGLAAGFALAADRPNSPLLHRRAEWRAQALRETKVLREKHAADLLQLEKELVLSGDYSGAAKVRADRWQVLPEIPRTERTVPAPAGEAAPSQPIELKPKAAAVSGGVVLDSETGLLAGWKSAGSAVRWLLPAGIKAGGYEVELTWSSPPDGGGEIVLREDLHSLRRPIKASAGINNFQTAVVGTLKLVSNSRMLEIASSAVKGSELFRLQSVRLLPVAGRK